MRIPKLFLSCIMVLAVLAGCQTSQDVVQNGSIQKRKYRKGYHFDGWKKHQRQQEENERNAVASDTAIADATPINKDQAVTDTVSAYSESKWWHVSPKAKTPIMDQQRGFAQDQHSPAPRKWKKRLREERLKNSVLAEKIHAKGQPIEPSQNPERDLTISLIIVGCWYVLGIYAIPLVNIAAAIVGLVYGIRAKRGGEEDWSGLAIGLNVAALILSVLATILLVLYILFIAWVEGYI